MKDEALGSAHAEERVHQGHVANVGASMGVEDLVEPAHAEQRMFGSDGCEVRSSVFAQADTDDPGHAEQRGPESGLLMGTQDQNEEPGSSHRMLAEDEFLRIVSITNRIHLRLSTNHRFTDPIIDLCSPEMTPEFRHNSRLFPANLQIHKVTIFHFYRN